MIMRGGARAALGTADDGIAETERVGSIGRHWAVSSLRHFTIELAKACTGQAESPRALIGSRSTILGRIN